MLSLEQERASAAGTVGARLCRVGWSREEGEELGCPGQMVNPRVPACLQEARGQLSPDPGQA